MLPTVLALCMQGGSPQIQIPKAEMPVVSSHQLAQTFTSLLNLPNPTHPPLNRRKLQVKRFSIQQKSKSEFVTFGEEHHEVVLIVPVL